MPTKNCFLVALPSFIFPVFQSYPYIISCNVLNQQTRIALLWGLEFSFKLHHLLPSSNYNNKNLAIELDQSIHWTYCTSIPFLDCFQHSSEVVVLSWFLWSAGSEASHTKYLKNFHSLTLNTHPFFFFLELWGLWTRAIFSHTLILLSYRFCHGSPSIFSLRNTSWSSNRLLSLFFWHSFLSSLALGSMIFTKYFLT